MTEAPHTQPIKLMVSGTEREALVYVPSGCDGRRPLPVVLIFHGASGTARAAMRTTGWPEKAEHEGFIAVFPEGTRPDPQKPPRLSNPQTWNDGSGHFFAGRASVDDVGFVRALLDALGEEFAVDPRRVYAAGFSNGGSFVFRLGVELSEQLAAIAVVAGIFWPTEQSPKRPVPLIYFLGEADPLVPPEGGRVRLPSGLEVEMPPVAESLERWARLLGCPDKPKLSQLQPGVRLYRCGPCREGSELRAYLIQGLGHVWPGGTTLFPEEVVGPSQSPVRATDLIWEFFAQHPKRSSGR